MRTALLSLLLVISASAKPQPEAKAGPVPIPQEDVKKNEKRQLVVDLNSNSLPTQFGVYDQLNPNLGNVYSPGFISGTNFGALNPGLSRPGILATSDPISVSGNDFRFNQGLFPGIRNFGLGGDPTLVLVTLPDGRSFYYRASFLFGNDLGGFGGGGFNSYNPYYPNNLGFSGTGLGFSPGIGFAGRPGFNQGFGGNNFGFGFSGTTGDRGFNRGFNNDRGFFPSRGFDRDGKRVIGSINPIDRRRTLLEREE